MPNATELGGGTHSWDPKPGGLALPSLPFPLRMREERSR